MAKVIPFRALRYNTAKIEDLSLVTTPPYDIISPDEQEAFYKAHPANVIRLEYGKTYDADTDANNRYTRAAADLKAFIDEQLLITEEQPAFYLYEEIFTLKGGEVKSFKGFMGLTELAEFSEKIVLPHEETLSKAKTDRFNLMQTTGANFSQIYCLYMDPERKLTAIIDRESAKSPDICFKTADGITHRLWIIKDEKTCAEITDGFAGKQLFIADGHHRYETALNFRNKCRAESNSADGAPYDYVMMMLVEMDDPGLVVFPTHRMLKNLASFDEAEALEKISRNFDAEKTAAAGNVSEQIENSLKASGDKCVFAFYTGGDYFYKLTLRDPEVMKTAAAGKTAAYAALDVSVLHTLILRDIFGIDTDKLANQTNLVYTRLADEAVSAVSDGSFTCSFLLNATKVRQIKDVSLANDKMPQKSTYFYPKIITGLVMNKFM